MRIFVFLHVLTMFGAVALSGGGEIFLMRIAGTRNPAAIRAAFDVHHRMGKAIPVVFVLGLTFGVVAIFVHRFNPLAPWLLLAYPLFVVGMLAGALGVGTWAARVRKAAASGGDTLSPDLEAALEDPRGRYAQFVFWVVIAAIVFVMVVKPLS